jgi:hypothetical protein
VPTVLHPSTPLVVSVHLMRSPKQEMGGRGIPIKVTITLMRGDNQLEMISREIMPESRQEMEVPVPDHLLEGAQPYSLTVEGEDYQRVEGSLFLHKVPLKIAKPRHIISINLNSNILIQKQAVQATISVHQTNLQPYSGPLHASLLSPQGVVVKRWTRQTRKEPLVFQYQLARHTPAGEWTIRASTQDVEQNETFFVLSFLPREVDISVDLPRRISPSASHLSGTITATYTQSGVPVWGNLSLSADIIERGIQNHA